jgi:hypothetical protein
VEEKESAEKRVALLECQVEELASRLAGESKRSEQHGLGRSSVGPASESRATESGQKVPLRNRVAPVLPWNFRLC